MSKILVISGIILVILLSLHFTGIVDANEPVKNALRQGNLQYEAAEYENALETYVECLETNPGDKKLSFNSAQAAYILEDYEGAIGYFENAEDSVERFMNSGNASYKLGESAEEDSQKAEYYSQALQIYLDGIMKYPQNIPLKYNYETVKNKLEEFTNESEQEQESNEDEENQEQESEGEENQEQESEGEENQEQESEGEENQEQESEGEESQEQNAEEENMESAQENQNEDQEQGSEDEQQEVTEVELDQQAIERILNMLESQEEESLKNNQNVVGGKEGKYGW